MRTKTLLLTAALGAITIASASAQVYSVNAVGYVNVTVPAGQFAILNNPLDTKTNKLSIILPDVPANTIVYKYTPGTGFKQSTKRSSGSWTGDFTGDETFNPGQAFFIKNAGAAALNITFVGEVMQSVNNAPLAQTYPVGFSLLGSIVPQTGKVEADLKMTSATNDKVHLFTGTGYDSYTRRSSGSWTGGSTSAEPILAVGTGMFYEAAVAGTWSRVFTVQ